MDKLWNDKGMKTMHWELRTEENGSKGLVTIEAVNEIINVLLQNAKHCLKASEREKEGKIDESNINNSEC